MIVPQNKEELVTAYEPFARRLKEFYSDIEIEGRCRIDPHNDSPVHVIDYHYIATRGRFRLVRTYVDGPIELKGGIHASIATPSDVFQLRQNDANADCQVTFLRENDQRAYSDAQQKLRLAEKMFVAPYSLLERPLIDFLQREQVQISNIREFKREGESVLQCRWSAVLPDKTPISGDFELLPDKSFAVADYKYVFHRPNGILTARCSTTYKGMKDGVPLLARTHYTQEVAGQLTADVTFNVTLIQKPTAEDRDFTLAAFNVERTGSRSNGRLRPVLALIILTLVLCPLAFGLRRFALTYKS